MNLTRPYLQNSVSHDRDNESKWRFSKFMTAERSLEFFCGDTERSKKLKKLNRNRRKGKVQLERAVTVTYVQSKFLYPTSRTNDISRLFFAKNSFKQFPNTPIYMNVYFCRNSSEILFIYFFYKILDTICKLLITIQLVLVFLTGGFKHFVLLSADRFSYKISTCPIRYFIQ